MIKPFFNRLDPNVVKIHRYFDDYFFFGIYFQVGFLSKIEYIVYFMYFIIFTLFFLFSF